jgi:hypothetical protein
VQAVSPSLSAKSSGTIAAPRASEASDQNPLLLHQGIFRHIMHFRWNVKRPRRFPDGALTWAFDQTKPNGQQVVMRPCRQAQK